MRLKIPRGAPPLLPTLLFIGIAACGKDDPPQDCPTDLPCATQYGANTFGCYIDGVPWVADIGATIFDPTAHKIQANFCVHYFEYVHNTNLFLILRTLFIFILEKYTTP